MFKCYLNLMVFALAISTSLISTSSLAHSPGQPPFWKINGQFTTYYPVPSTSLSDFDLPQDKATENYLIGQQLNFEIDTSVLEVPKEVVDQTKFNWDFGDGNFGQGLQTTHSYSQMGSYLIKLNITPPESSESILLQSTLVNILPSKDYQLPKSKIKVNNFEAKDPLVDILNSDLKSEFNFDGTGSSSGDSKIVEYFWDLGDLNTSSEAKTSHTYKAGLGIVFPLLRIKTADGFISDSYLQISDPSIYGGNLQNQPDAGQKSSTLNYLVYFLVALAIITVGLFFRPFFKKLFHL